MAYPIAITQIGDLEVLEAELVKLAIHGFASVREDHIPWFKNLGVVQLHKGCVCASPDWLDTVMPVENPEGLLRRTLLRDPLFRLHVDIMVASVLQVIGASARWERLESLLIKNFRSFAPRFVSLLQWASLETGKKAHELSMSDWASVDCNRERFASWDEGLWGVVGEPATVFPILQELYAPLCGLPVCCSLSGEDLGRDLLAKLVSSAQQGEGVYCQEADKAQLMSLAHSGVPIRWREELDGTVTANLVGRTVILGPLVHDPTMRPVSEGVPDSARQSLSLAKSDSVVMATLWDLGNCSKKPVGFVSLDAGSVGWPEDMDEQIPEQARLPEASLLRDLVKVRSISLPSDKALERLAEHLFFGFWVQVLLLEALDRELGEESLILAPPTGAVVENIEEATHVFYRPRPGSSGAAASRETLDLGTLDQVLGALAENAGIRRIYVPFCSPERPWSLGLRLMRSADLIQGRHDRWTIAGHVLDRLHAGGLMTGVIRKGQPLRERLHEILLELWAQREVAAKPRRL